MENTPTNRLRASAVSVLLGMALSMPVSHVDAQPRDYMKKSSPEELYVSFFEGEQCPWSMEHVVDGALVRSRIRRKPLWIYDETVLLVNVRCMQAQRANGRTSGLVYSVEVSFGAFIRSEPSAQYSFDTIRVDAGKYWTIGTSTLDDLGRQFLENNLRDEVEEALVDYLRANFDL